MNKPTFKRKKKKGKNQTNQNNQQENTELIAKKSFQKLSEVLVVLLDP